jgi:hypothetical protein
MLLPHYRLLLKALSMGTPLSNEPLPTENQQMLYLGADFGASISLDCARRIQYIDGRPGLSFIDIWILKGDGDTHIIRSARTDFTKEECTKLVAELTRQIGAFLFVNKDVKLEAPQPKAEELKEDDILAGSRRHR